MVDIVMTDRCPLSGFLFPRATSREDVPVHLAAAARVRYPAARIPCGSDTLQLCFAYRLYAPLPAWENLTSG